MQNYIQIKIANTSEEEQEILIALLNEEGYEGFEESANSLAAFIPESSFDGSILKEILSPFGKTFEQALIAPKNWNAEWEQSYEPVIVDDFVAIRAHFHEVIPGVKHEIIITPKMSFGTGHHATTWQVMKLMEGITFQEKTVFDFGAGTGVLAILAEQLGAASVLALDYDDWCIENAQENVATNHCTKITVVKGDAPPVNQVFDIILANINRHILLGNMQAMANALTSNGYLLMSGFYASENQLLIDAALAQGLQLKQSSERHQWSSLLFQKTS